MIFEPKLEDALSERAIFQNHLIFFFFWKLFAGGLRKAILQPEALLDPGRLQCGSLRAILCCRPSSQQPMSPETQTSQSAQPRPKEPSLLMSLLSLSLLSLTHSLTHSVSLSGCLSPSISLCSSSLFLMFTHYVSLSLPITCCLLSLICL